MKDGIRSRDEKLAHDQRTADAVARRGKEYMKQMEATKAEMGRKPRKSTRQN